VTVGFLVGNGFGVSSRALVVQKLQKLVIVEISNTEIRNSITEI